MADVTQNNKARTKAFLLKKAIEKSASRRKRMQITLNYLVSRRKRLLNVCFLSLVLVMTRANIAVTQNRSCRRLQRNTGWFDLVWSHYSDKRFKKTLRVSRETFNFILSRIRHILERDTVSEEPISPEFRLAVCLYRLSRGDYYYTIAEMTGLGVSTVCTICQEVTRAILESMWRDTVSKHLPKTIEDFKRKMLDMEEMWQFPYCWAVIDGCHIPIKCPATWRWWQWWTPTVDSFGVAVDFLAIRMTRLYSSLRNFGRTLRTVISSLK